MTIYMWGYPVKLTIEKDNTLLDVTDAITYNAVEGGATIDTEKVLDTLTIDDERPSNARKLLRELARELERNGL